MCWGATMSGNRRGRLAQTLFAALGLIAVTPAAQAFTTNIVADGTLGTTVSAAGPAYNITGGTLAGGNQFHSFESLSIGAGDAAIFNGPVGTANVISRVTGGSASGIDGTIASTIAGANVFLLNPAGVMFGPNAQIAVDGAFHASTAGYLGLADGERFYADPGQASTLTTAAPAAFGFLDANPAGISVQGNGFSALPSFAPPAGTDLSLVGGAVTVNGQILYAPLGRINLAAVGSPGEAVLTGGAVDVDGFAALGPVSIGGGSFIDTSALYIRGGQITVSGAYLSPGAGAFLLGLPAPGAHLNNGLIDIQARGDLTINPGASGSLIGSTIQQFFLPPPPPALGSGATVLLEAGETLSIQGVPGAPGSMVIGSDRWQPGPAGELVFKGRNVEIIGTNDIYALNYAPGAGPTTTVEAETVTLNGGGLGALNFGPGDSGAVEITADQVTLTNEFGPAIIGAQNGGGGAGGAIVVNADRLALNATGAAPVLISGANFNVGSGASITLNVDELAITTSSSGRAAIEATTSAPGPAGSITIGSAAMPASTVLLQGDGVTAGIFTSAIGGFSGAAGDIEIHTGTLSQIGDTEIGANSLGSGDGGNVSVRASEAIRLAGRDGSTESVIAAGSSAGPFAGSGGSITLVSPLLEMTNATITTRTERATDAGDVDITVGALAAADSTITSETRDDGNAGSVTVSADSVTLTDGAQIRSFSGAVSTVSGAVLVGTGDAGTVTVTATESLSVSGSSAATNRSSALNTQTRGVGAGGALNVTAGQLTVGTGGLVAADTGGDGDGGALNVTAGSVVVDGGEISSGSGISVAITNGQVDLLGSGEGGDVMVMADNGVTVRNNGRIAASSRGAGFAGNVLVDGGTEVQVIGGSIDTESLVSDGGDIEVIATDLVLLNNGKITTSVVGAGGTGGNIAIDPQFVVLQGASQVIANATNPLAVQAGNITIVGDYILISQDSLVQASGPTNAQDGEIIIEGPDGDLARALAQLPESYLEAAGLLKAGCGIGRAGLSTLVLSGRGGVPVGPDRYASSLATGLKVGAETTAQREDLVPDDLMLAFGPDDPTATGWLLAGLGCQ